MPSPTPSLRVLVVDDDPILTDLLATLLGVLGHTAETANTGDLALQRLNTPRAAGQEPASQKPLDIVLIDLHMPGMHGSSLATAIAALPHPPRLICMSGSAPTADQRARFLGFLQKPFTIEDLQQALLAPKLSTAHPSNPALHPAPLDLSIYDRLAAAMPPAQLHDLYHRTLIDVRQTAASFDTATPDDRIELLHKLHGSCSMVGAMELAHLAQHLDSPPSLPPGAPAESPRSYKILMAADRLERMLRSITR